ncbi:MAG: histidine phosphatase family protein [Planctomycetota bacterium]
MSAQYTVPPSMMNRRLMLMRHAKSDWADESLRDHDRPLNRRGRRDVPRMADWMRQLGRLPDQILCSSSTRTEETSRRLLDAWGVDVQVRLISSLYLAAPATIVDAIEEHGGDAATLLVIAHNPGMAGLVSGLAGRSIEMPTAAIGVFDVDLSAWQAFGSSRGVSLVDFAKPKELA